MFGFSKKNKSISQAYNLNIKQDIHSHILPGLDDGSPDIETSLQLIKGLHALGIKRSIATPHVIGDMFRNTPDTINGALEKLRVAIQQDGIDFEVHGAAEYMLDDYFMNLMNAKTPLLTLEKNLLLTELSYAMPPDKLEKIAFEIIINDYKPIMAHPERYFYYHKNYDAYYRLKELGFLLQVNLLSLTGYYGIPAARAAKFIFENNLADLVGTDMHHIKHLEILSKKENLMLLRKYMGDKLWNDFDAL
jgi:tyrosine-protein phosphatase YwqE